MRRFLLLVGIIAGVFLIATGGSLYYFHLQNYTEPPRIEIEDDADATRLRQRIESAAGKDIWNRMAAFEFVFMPGNHHHFHDLRRGLIETSFNQDGNRYTVQLDSGRPGHYLVRENTVRIKDKNIAREFYEKAKRHYDHDIFWLRPANHLINPSLKIGYVGRRALLAEFQEQASRPGRIFLYVTDDQGRLSELRVWASSFWMRGLPVRLEKIRKYKIAGRSAGNSVLRMHTVLTSRYFHLELNDIQLYGRYPLPGEKDRFSVLRKDPKK